MNAFLVTPTPAGSRTGNRVTALRWAKRLRELGWRVRIEQQWRGEATDLLVALHARKSHDSIARHADQRPHDPRLVALTGTDLYGDIHTDASARQSLELASRLVLLQPLGLRQLPERLHDKTRTLRQSAVAPQGVVRVAAPGTFTVCVLGHLREVKDPLLAAVAVRRLDPRSRVRVFHLGAALDEEWRARAQAAEVSAEGRWTWLGARSRLDTLRVLNGARALLVTSRSEGGANVVSEAIAAGVPVLSTRIDGSLGILGETYPGLFEVGDPAGLAELLARTEGDLSFYADLHRRTLAFQPLVRPAAERASFAALLAELGERYSSADTGADRVDSGS